MDGFWAIRRRRAWMWLLFLTALPAIAVGTWIHPRLEVVVAVGWVLAWVAASVLHGWSRCPRCGKRCFLQWPQWQNPWSGRCLHCDTRLYWSDSDLGVKPPLSSADR